MQSNKDLTTEEFYVLLNQKTKKILETKKNIKEQKEKKKNDLQKDSNNLANLILRNWRTKARKASNKGYTFVDLYSPKLNDNRNIFLLCAPVGYGLEWFTNQRIKPVMHILKEQVKPFDIQYIRLKNLNKFTNVVRLTWIK